MWCSQRGGRQQRPWCNAGNTADTGAGAGKAAYEDVIGRGRLGLFLYQLHLVALAACKQGFHRYHISYSAVRLGNVRLQLPKMSEGTSRECIIKQQTADHKRSRGINRVDCAHIDASVCAYTDWDERTRTRRKRRGLHNTTAAPSMCTLQDDMSAQKNTQLGAAIVTRLMPRSGSWWRQVEHTPRCDHRAQCRCRACQRSCCRWQSPRGVQGTICRAVAATIHGGQKQRNPDGQQQQR